MIPQNNCNSVIKRYPGPNTGDEFIQTIDGTIWEVVRNLPERSTGDRQGFLIKNKVHEI